MKQIQLIFRYFLVIGIITLGSLFTHPPVIKIGQVLAVERSEDSTEVKAVITAENAQIKFFFVKAVPYVSPARIDVFAKDINGNPLYYDPQTLLHAIPDSVFVQFNLPYRNEQPMEPSHRPF